LIISKEYLLELRQASLNELQAVLERVQQLKGAIAMVDTLIKETEKLSDEEYNNYVHIIYVDRNHPPGEFGIIEIVDDIDK
jgi:hypothetical protein